MGDQLFGAQTSSASWPAEFSRPRNEQTRPETSTRSDQSLQLPPPVLGGGSGWGSAAEVTLNSQSGCRCERRNGMCGRGLALARNRERPVATAGRYIPIPIRARRISPGEPQSEGTSKRSSEEIRRCRPGLESEQVLSRMTFRTSPLTPHRFFVTCPARGRTSRVSED